MLLPKNLAGAWPFLSPDCHMDLFDAKRVHFTTRACLQKEDRQGKGTALKRGFLT